MNKEINYSGHTAVPSDYECQDGELAYSLNLINEDGAVHPVQHPKEIGKLRDATDRVLCIHKIIGKPEHFICTSADGKLYWFASDTHDYVDIIILPAYAAEAMGNILVVLSESKGLQYIKWNPETSSYLHLGARPPFPNIEFGLSHAPVEIEDTELYIAESSSALDNLLKGIFGNARFSNHIEYVDPITGYSSGSITAEEKLVITNAVYAAINKSMAKHAESGLFDMPFFVRYAIRLFDGSYAWHSAPVLMLPTTGRPHVLVSGSRKNKELMLKLRHVSTGCSLLYRIFPNGLGNMQAWEDIVAGVDIFVSAPIYTFSSDDTLQFVCDYSAERSFSHRQVQGDFASEVFDDIPQWEAYRFDTGTPPQSDAQTASFAPDTTVTIASKLSSVSNFYKIAHIPFDELVNAAFTTHMNKTVPIEPLDLRNLLTRPTLQDDYQSHASIAPRVSYVYNARLNVADFEYVPASPYFLRSASAFTMLPEPNLQKVSITVLLRKNGTIVSCELPDTSNELAASNVSVCESLANGAFPRWIFYPDSSAFKMIIRQGAFYRELPLTPHDFLEGAYWLDEEFFPAGTKDTGSDNRPGMAPPAIFPSYAKSVTIPNKIYSSEVNNPFYFPVTGINTINVGSIVALRSSARALSQGQFGQFPLYAFTDEGIWALEISSTGTYVAKQPITRDVCIHADGITQIDAAVLFPSARGIMMISGSQTHCLTDTINSEYPFDISKLSGIDKLHSLLKHNETRECLPILAFSRFLETSNMLYDYTHQRIILFNRNYSYAYVYSLKSQLWGMIHSDMKYAVNSYPDAMAVSHTGYIKNFSVDTSEHVSCMLISRPLKLGDRNLHKTIDTVILRGHFRKGHVQSVLYGSRDLEHWHLVWSSKDHFLRGFRGTPYKYYRIALLCNLDAQESISGASIQFTPRLTNQPR